MDVDGGVAWLYRKATGRPPSKFPREPRGPVHTVRKRRFARRCENSPRDLTLFEQPSVVRGRDTHLMVGDRVRIGPRVLFYLDQPGSTIEVGDDCVINLDVKISARRLVKIGDGTGIAWNTSLTDSTWHPLDGIWDETPLIIGKRVWIGSGVQIIKGLTIGDGAVIGAGSVVTKDVPAGMLAQGVPAQVVREVTWRWA